MSADSGRITALSMISASVVLTAIAQILMKIGMLEMHGLALPPSLQAAYADAGSWLPALSWVLSGVFCYGVSMLCWLIALARYELSLAYPMLSLSYVLVYVFAALWPGLDENITPVKTLAILLIMAGVILITYTGRGRRA